MSYLARVENAWGMEGATWDYNRSSLSVSSSNRFIILNARFLNGNAPSFLFSNELSALSQITGRTVQRITSAGAFHNAALLWNSDNTMADGILPDMNFAPASLGSLGSITFNYGYELSGFTASSSVTIQSDSPIRTVTDIKNVIHAAGGTDLVLSPDIVAATPQIVYVDVDDSDNDQTITVEVTDTSSYTVTVLDGDPPYLANVSDTEPTPRGVGDIWFNPSNGKLSVYTEDS